MATKTAKGPSARERLLAASDELFYRDGVHSTGIDAVIEKAGVAKGSLYYIFGGKDELVAAYLSGRLERWRQLVEAAQAGFDDPDAKILAVFDAIADYVSLPEYRAALSTTPPPKRRSGRPNSRRSRSTAPGCAGRFCNSPPTPGQPTPRRWPTR